MGKQSSELRVLFFALLYHGDELSMAVTLQVDRKLSVFTFGFD